MFPDISEFQGAVDWDTLQAAYRAGAIEAVAMRSSFGTVRADQQFVTNQQECRARGIPAIYYHFCYPTFNTPQAEAAFFNNVVGPLQANEAMVGDFEDDGTNKFPRGMAGSDWAKAFLTAVAAPQNATWFYTYTSLYDQINLGVLAATWPFWWADYSARTDNPYGAIARQYTDAGSTPGVSGSCDQSRVLQAPLSQWLTGGNEMTSDQAKMLLQLWELLIGGAPQPEGQGGVGWIKVGIDQLLVQTAALQPPAVDVNALAAALAPHLPPATDPQQVATDVVAKLSAQLAKP